MARGGVEETRLEAKAKDTKKIRGQGQGQPFRGQTFSRPRTGMLEAKARTKDTAASVFRKKRSSKIFFRQSPICRRGQNFRLVGRPKSHAMTSSKIFKRGTFCGTKIS